MRQTQAHGGQLDADAIGLAALKPIRLFVGHGSLPVSCGTGQRPGIIAFVPPVN
jgi:hypothetical protein